VVAIFIEMAAGCGKFMGGLVQNALYSWRRKKFWRAALFLTGYFLLCGLGGLLPFPLVIVPYLGIIFGGAYVASHGGCLQRLIAIVLIGIGWACLLGVEQFYHFWPIDSEYLAKP
jgi:hypothetical protein